MHCLQDLRATLLSIIAFQMSQEKRFSNVEKEEQTALNVICTFAKGEMLILKLGLVIKPDLTYIKN